VELIYGGIAAFSAVLFLLLAVKNPPLRPAAWTGSARPDADGLKHALTVKPFWLYLLSRYWMGIFNASPPGENIIRRAASPNRRRYIGRLCWLAGAGAVQSALLG